jgi:hypothetical protein
MENFTEGDQDGPWRDLRALFEKQPGVCVMQRAVMENVFAPAKLDAIFHSAAVAQYERELLFSTLVDLTSLVVCRISPSVHAAYVRLRDRIPVSVKALYDKLKNVEVSTSRGLVQHTAGEASTLVERLKGCRAPLLPGYRTRILDGNHLGGSHHRPSQCPVSPCFHQTITRTTDRLTFRHLQRAG